MYWATTVAEKARQGDERKDAEAGGELLLVQGITRYCLVFVALPH